MINIGPEDESQEDDNRKIDIIKKMIQKINFTDRNCKYIN